MSKKKTEEIKTEEDIKVGEKSTPKSKVVEKVFSFPTLRKSAKGGTKEEALKKIKKYE